MPNENVPASITRSKLIAVVREAASHLDAHTQERLIAAVADYRVTKIARGCVYSYDARCPAYWAGLTDTSKPVSKELTTFMYRYDDATAALVGRVKVMDVID